VQQQSPLRQQQLIAAGQNPIAQQQQPQQAAQRESVVSGTTPGIMQTPQQLQTTAATGTWIPQQAENAGSGTFTETSHSGIKLHGVCQPYSEERIICGVQNTITIPKVY
jgi:hypothetical protein